MADISVVPRSEVYDWKLEEREPVARRVGTAVMSLFEIAGTAGVASVIADVIADPNMHPKQQVFKGLVMFAGAVAMARDVRGRMSSFFYRS